MAKFEGVWVKIKGVMANPKNRQMWDFGSWEVEFGIGSSGMKYAEWNCRGVSEVSGKTELKPRRYGRKTEFYFILFYFFQEGICNGAKVIRNSGIRNGAEVICNKWICNSVEVISNKWICNGAELTGNSSGQRKSVIVQLKIDMDPRYV